MSKLREKVKILQNQLKENAEKIRELEKLKDEKKMQVEIHVFCVVRPCEKHKKPAISCPDDNNQLVIFDPPSTNRMFKTSRFYFERVFDTVSKINNVFESASEIINSCLDEFNVFVFFYGSSGSGKSHLIRDDNGFIYLAAQRIFNTIIYTPSSSNWKHSVKVSNWDMYNQDIVDVLTAGQDRKPHTVVPDLDGNGVHVSNLTLVEMSGAHEISKILKLAGNKRGEFLAQCGDDHRMSSLFQFHIQGFNTATKDEKRGSVFVVELAANDLVHYQHATDWEDYMVQLSSQSIRSSNFYANLISFIEQNYKKPNKTLVYATISPEEEHLRESLNTLKFVSRLSTMYKSKEVK